MIDWERVEELRDEIGPDDFDEVVEMFLEEVQEVIARLRTAPDIAQLGADLHFLKGSALNLGFQSFSALCQAGETLSGEGKPEDVNLPEVLQSFEDSKVEFENKLAAA